MYYSIAHAEAWSTCGVLPVIPPPANAVGHNHPATRWHVVRYIKDEGVHSFRTNTGTASAPGRVADLVRQMLYWGTPTGAQNRIPAARGRNYRVPRESV
jgi:hypothetical protein